MDIEIYKATMNVVADAIKILGPAIITAFVGYRAGKNQFLLRIEELEKINQFKAYEKIFEFQKEKLVKVDQSIASLNESLMQIAGMSVADDGSHLDLTAFINKHLASHISGLSFQLNHINDELIQYQDTLQREFELMKVYISRSSNIKRPVKKDEVMDTIYELLEIYGFASHCLRSLIEKEALRIFEPYTKRI